MPRKSLTDPAIQERNERIGKYLRERRNKLGLSAEAAAGLAGLTGSFVTRVENGKAGITTETLSKLAGALRLSLDQVYNDVSSSNLIHGKGDPDYQRLPVLTYEQVKDLPDLKPETIAKNLKSTIYVDLDTPPSSFAMWIRDKSMETEFRLGDLVIFSAAVPPRPGDFVIATDAAGESTFKQYRVLEIDKNGHEVFELRPLNPVYPVMRSDRQALTLVGTLIEHRRFRED